MSAEMPRQGRPREQAPDMVIEGAAKSTEGVRTEPRRELRSGDFVREKPREPHEKYDLPSGTAVRGMDYMWGALKVPHSTQPSPRLGEFLRAGWRFARAADFPELSGYKPDHQINPRFIELGIETEVRVDDPVVLNNSALLLRPKALSQEANHELEQRAKRQISDHLRRQKEVSEAAIGSNRTTMRMTYGPADEAPSDAEAEI